MKKNLLLILIFPFLINGCSSLKRLKTVTQGKVVQQNYIKEIPFEFIDNQIILQVEINGKFYPFIFDTGNDLTSIDLTLLEEVDYNSNKVNNEITDAAKKTRINEYISIKKLKIGEIEFENIGAQTTDFSHFKQINACNHYVGLIGSNLMRKAKWQIDYQTKTIKITDDIKKLNVNKSATKFKTNSGNYGGADIKILLNGFEDEYTFDTGSSSFISADKLLFDKINSKKKIQHTTRTGINSFTAHGFTTGTNYKSIINNIKLENIELSDQIVDFEKGQSKLLGNEFLKHYLVTLDWNEEYFYLEKKLDFEKPKINQYQVVLYPNYLTNKIQIYGYWNDNKLEETVELGSEIISLNDIDVSNLKTSELCDFWYNRKEEFMKNTINAKILNKGKIKNVQLKIKQLLPK